MQHGKMPTKVTTFHEEITSVATSAVQEGVLEEMMGKVSAMWAKTEFEVSVMSLSLVLSTFCRGSDHGVRYFMRHPPACFFCKNNREALVGRKLRLFGGPG